MSYFYTASVWVFLFWLAFTGLLQYNWWGALIMALVGGIAAANVMTWWQEPHRFKPPKLRPMFTDKDGQETRGGTRSGSSYENIAMARQRQARQQRRREGLATRALRRRSR